MVERELRKECPSEWVIKAVMAKTAVKVEQGLRDEFEVHKFELLKLKWECTKDQCSAHSCSSQ